MLPQGEIGEVVLRGHNVFAGYLNNPEATAAALVDGWFRTGDLGVKDADGFLSIVDRKKDLIIRGGFNVYPREVEEVLAGHPGVAQVAVVAVADEIHGEEICAVVVRSPEGADLDQETLIAWSQERLGQHKYPRRVEFFEALPLGPERQDPQAGADQGAVTRESGTRPCDLPVSTNDLDVREPDHGELSQSREEVMRLPSRSGHSAPIVARIRRPSGGRWS